MYILFWVDKSGVRNWCRFRSLHGLLVFVKTNNLEGCRDSLIWTNDIHRAYSKFYIKDSLSEEGYFREKGECPDENGVPVERSSMAYEIPKRFQDLLTLDFCQELQKQVRARFKNKADLRSKIEGVIYLYGWDHAFEAACRAKDCLDFYEYERSLSHTSWEDSMRLSLEILDIFTEYGLLEDDR
jgi:hypothetical protein